MNAGVLSATSLIFRNVQAGITGVAIDSRWVITVFNPADDCDPAVQLWRWQWDDLLLRLHGIDDRSLRGNEERVCLWNRL